MSATYCTWGKGLLDVKTWVPWWIWPEIRYMKCVNNTKCSSNSTIIGLFYNIRSGLYFPLKIKRKECYIYITILKYNWKKSILSSYFASKWRLFLHGDIIFKLISPVTTLMKLKLKYQVTLYFDGPLYSVVKVGTEILKNVTTALPLAFWAL